MWSPLRKHVMVFVICCLTSFSLRHKDTRPASANSYRHLRVLPMTQEQSKSHHLPESPPAS